MAIEWLEINNGCSEDFRVQDTKIIITSSGLTKADASTLDPTLRTAKFVKLGYNKSTDEITMKPLGVAGTGFKLNSRRGGSKVVDAAMLFEKFNIKPKGPRPTGSIRIDDDEEAGVCFLKLDTSNADKTTAYLGKPRGRKPKPAVNSEIMQHPASED